MDGWIIPSGWIEEADGEEEEGKENLKTKGYTLTHNLDNILKFNLFGLQKSAKFPIIALILIIFLWMHSV